MKQSDPLSAAPQTQGTPYANSYGLEHNFGQKSGNLIAHPCKHCWCARPGPAQEDTFSGPGGLYPVFFKATLFEDVKSGKNKPNQIFILAGVFGGACVLLILAVIALAVCVAK